MIWRIMGGEGTAGLATLAFILIGSGLFSYGCY